MDEGSQRTIGKGGDGSFKHMNGCSKFTCRPKLFTGLVYVTHAMYNLAGHVDARWFDHMTECDIIVMKAPRGKYNCDPDIGLSHVKNR